MTTPVALTDPGRLLEEEAEAVEQALVRVTRSGVFVGGPAVTTFEEAFADLHGSEFRCVGVGNGEDGLTLTLVALNMGLANHVLVPANDGGFAALAVQNAGLVPIPVDVSELDGLIGVAEVDAAKTPATVALVATHLHGAMCDVIGLSRWAADHSVHLVEDCSQAHGACSSGIKAGTTGVAAIYSHYPTKNLGAFGDAGSVVTRDHALAESIRQLSNYGWGSRYSVEYKGGINSRLDSLQASVLVARLPFLARNNERRRMILDTYRQRISNAEFLIPTVENTVAHHAVMTTKNRESLTRHLTRNSIGWGIHYPHVIQDMRGLEVFETAPTPISRELAEIQISLPCFPTITNDEVERVVQTISSQIGSPP